MPGFELEQVDGGSPIERPYGETVLGRGLFLGVNDKRVSRNHGILENQNGQLRLKLTHLNPCFIQTNIVTSPQPLEKDQWHCLKEGDIFSLMPGKYIYRVRVKDDDQTPRNSQAFEEEVQKCSSGPAALSLDSATLEANSCMPTSPSATLTEDKGAGDPSHTLSSPNEAATKSQQDESDLPQKYFAGLDDDLSQRCCPHGNRSSVLSVHTHSKKKEHIRLVSGRYGNSTQPVVEECMENAERVSPHPLVRSVTVL